MLQPVELVEVDAVQHDACAVKAAQTFAHRLVQQAIVGDGGLPAHVGHAPGLAQQPVAQRCVECGDVARRAVAGCDTEQPRQVCGIGRAAQAQAQAAQHDGLAEQLALDREDRRGVALNAEAANILGDVAIVECQGRHLRQRLHDVADQLQLLARLDPGRRIDERHSVEAGVAQGPGQGSAMLARQLGEQSRARHTPTEIPGCLRQEHQ